MPHRYPPHEQARIMMILRQNDNDVAATHQQTGVPKRTLYDWLQREREAAPPYPVQQQQQSTGDLPLPHKSSINETQDNNDLPTDLSPADLRARLVAQVQQLITALDDAPPRAAYYITLTLTRLLDQIARLNTVLTPVTPAEPDPDPDPDDDGPVRMVFRDRHGVLREWGDWESWDDNDDESEPKIPPT